MINESAKYTANIGSVLISTANSALDGSGTLGSVITGASNGTLVKRITIKAITNTTHGMVRLFVSDGTKTRLIKEVDIPAVTKASVDRSFQFVFLLNFNLRSGYILKASTENAESFQVIAEGLNWTY